jgi:hypothetical protein
LHGDVASAFCILHREVGQTGARDGLHCLCLPGFKICRVSNQWLAGRLFTYGLVFSWLALDTPGLPALSYVRGGDGVDTCWIVSGGSFRHPGSEDQQEDQPVTPKSPRPPSTTLLTQPSATHPRYRCLGARRWPAFRACPRLPRRNPNLRVAATILCKASSDNFRPRRLALSV